MCHQASNSSSSNNLSGIDPVSFYGNSALKDLGDAVKIILLPQSCYEFRNLFAPSTVWKNFRKQQEVLDFVSTTNCDLFPFTFQTDNGDRLFLAAHPISFWYVDEQRPLHDRHTYEIIREFKPCKLYFDLEFDIPLNPHRNGDLMVKIFLNFIFVALKNRFNIVCEEKDVLNLDSSTENKFSCHLIFPNVIFENNYATGYFVKQLCYELKSISDDASLHLLKGAAKDLELPKELFVTKERGQRVLFCDEGVYTKNRHFRLYKSSKHGKNAVLRLSGSNAFPIQGIDEASGEKFIFLNSLITYCDTQISPPLKYELAEMSPIPKMNVKLPRFRDNEYLPSSPYSDIDNYINALVSPGRIYRSTFFPEKKIIVYDIIGNRYCHNIGRQHKSNNIMYVVNVNSLTYYQKCYDPDCGNFKSEIRKLPVDEDVFVKYDIDDELVLAAVQQCEKNLNLSELTFTSTNRAHSSMHVSDGEVRSNEKGNEKTLIDDEILLAVTEQCELSASLTEDWDPVVS